MQSADGHGSGRGLATALLLCCLAGCDRGATASGPEEEAAVVEEPALAAAVAPEALAGLPAGMTAEQVERGRALFDVCAPCHGVDASGTQLGPSLRDGEWIHGTGAPEEIAAIVRDGVPEPGEFGVPMPPMGGGAFEADEIEAVAAYVHVISRQPAGP